MKHTKMLIANLFIWGFFLTTTHTAWAQGRPVTIRVRNGDGAPLVGEALILWSLPDDEPVAPECITNDRGECAWTVSRGIYQVQFVNRTLDNISALAVAESGLDHFGITVGDAGIGDAGVAYHFVLHNDGRIYFDQTPHTVLPSPIIPTLEDLHWSVEATATPTPAVIVLEPEPTSALAGPVVHASTPGAEPADEAGTAGQCAHRLRLFIVLLAGLLIGVALHLTGEGRKKADSHAAPPAAKGESRATGT